MLWLISSSVRLRTLVVVVAAGLLILGAVSIRDKPLDVIPELALPSLTVKTESLGLSSAEVESLITVPLEADLLNGVPWLQVIQSESMAGLSTIEMVFAPGTDMMKARQMVQERLTQAHALPNVSSPPVMLQPVSSASRVMNVGLSSKTVSLIDMSIQARWNIAPRLAGVPGVANVSIWGQRERQVQVLVDARNLLKKGVKLEQVIKTAGEAVWSSPLTYLNSSTPGTGGFIETPNQRLSIRHQLPISTVGTFAKVPLSGTTVRVGDVAYLAEGHQAMIGDAIVGEGQGLMLAIEKFPGFNTADVTRGVERALDELKPGLPGIEISTTIYRPASFIERATGNLSRAAIVSVILVAAVLGLLMGGWRAAVISMAAISLSFVSAVVLLQAAGIPLSMMVIGGLLMASGVVVHDGVLDADNLRRRLRAPRQEGQSGFLVLARAMLETRRPMLYASLIVALAMLPVLFMQSRSAAFFAPMAWSYIAAIAVSTLVALVVTPALAAVLFGNTPPSVGANGLTERLAGLWDRICSAVVRRPIACIGAGVVAAVACFALWTPLERNLVPSFKETDLLVEWQGPPGTSLQAMLRSTEGLIHDLKQIPGVHNAHANLGRAVLCNCERATDVNTGQVWVNIDPKAEYETVVDAVEAAVASYPGMRGQVGTYLSTRLRQALTGDPDSITVRVYGRNLDVIRTKAEEIRAAIEKIPGIENARVEQQIEEPAIEVKVDVDRAAEYGLKPGDVRRVTSALVGGITVGALFEEQKVFDVVVWGRPELRDNVEDIRNLMINSENGSQARLAQVADVRISSATSIIRRQGASRRIDVLAKVDERALGGVANDVASAVRQVAFPFEHRAEVLGEYREQRASLRSIYGYVAAAAVLMFLLMQAVLRSWALTALSLLGAPIAVLGGVAAIAITDGTLSLGSLLGLGAVLALTVRQGVSLVTHFQHLQLNEGEPFDEALVRRGVREQFLSIMASSIATVALVLPFAMMGDVAGLEIAHPLTVVVLGGVVTATIATLLVLPAIYLRFAEGWIKDRLDLGTEAAS